MNASPELLPCVEHVEQALRRAAALGELSANHDFRELAEILCRLRQDQLIAIYCEKQLERARQTEISE